MSSNIRLPSYILEAIRQKSALGEILTKIERVGEGALSLLSGPAASEKDRKTLSDAKSHLLLVHQHLLDIGHEAQTLLKEGGEEGRLVDVLERFTHADGDIRKSAQSFMSLVMEFARQSPHADLRLYGEAKAIVDLLRTVTPIGYGLPR